MLLSILVPKARSAIPLQANELWAIVLHHLKLVLYHWKSYKSTMIVIDLHYSFTVA